MLECTVKHILGGGGENISREPSIVAHPYMSLNLTAVEAVSEQRNNSGCGSSVCMEIL